MSEKSVLKKTIAASEEKIDAPVKRGLIRITQSSGKNSFKK